MIGNLWQFCGNFSLKTAQEMLCRKAYRLSDKQSMSKTSKSPLKVARAAYEAGQKALPRYAHKFSRRDFTCAQLFAIRFQQKVDKAL